MHDDLPELSMPEDEQAQLAAETFRMLSDPTRIKLLWALLQGESSVTCLAELAGVSATSVSQHLAKLRLAGLVRGRREGTYIYYTAADTHVQALLAEALSHAEHAVDQLGSEDTHRHRLSDPPPAQRAAQEQ
jgi:DNA-binding transcriptional ArsR family regulator